MTETIAKAVGSRGFSLASPSPSSRAVSLAPAPAFAGIAEDINVAVRVPRDTCTGYSPGRPTCSGRSARTGARRTSRRCSGAPER